MLAIDLHVHESCMCVAVRLLFFKNTIHTLCPCRYSFFLGEFGIVYKGHMIKHHNNGQYLDEYIAIKTLKGTCI